MRSTTDLPASSVRYQVLGLLCLLSFILYLDRICISQAVSSIEAELGLSHTEMSFVLSAFTVAYGLFEVPIGHWGDRYGSRGVLARIAIWWSVFTMLTGACNGLMALVVVRFLFGAGEAGALPNMARVVARWFPPGERGPAQGLVMTAALIGGAASPIFAESLIQNLGWRWSFAALGIPGIVWAIIFYAWFRDDPAEHPAVNPAERNLLEVCRHQSTEHPSVPWKFVLAQANLWLLGGIISCGAFTTYMFFSWYPTYLKLARGVDPLSASWFAGLVLASGAAGSLVGGFLSDFLVRRTGRRGIRCRIGIIAMTSAALAMAASPHCDRNELATACTAWACFAVHVQAAAWWGVVTDVSGKHLGALFGLMNSLGLPGAIGSQLFLGRFVDWMASYGYEGRAQWDPSFNVYAIVLLVGAVAWYLVDADRSLIEPPKEVSV